VYVDRPSEYNGGDTRVVYVFMESDARAYRVDRKNRIVSAAAAAAPTSVLRSSAYGAGRSAQRNDTVRREGRDARTRKGNGRPDVWGNV